MYENPLPQASVSRRLLIILLVLAAAGGLSGYALRQHNIAARTATENQQLTASLNQTQGEIQALNTKVTQMVDAEQRREQAAQAAAQARQRAVVVNGKRRRVEDPRWKQMQAKLDAQGKAIDDTRAQLESTGTELRGSIAMTHDELVVLQKKGERNYYEFDLDKSKNFAKAGPVSLSLRKASTKDRYADLKLVVDDAQLTQKHVNLYQPVMFYAGDNGAPVELVVNSVTKNHIHGYISEPKYRAAELAAMTQPNNAAAGAGAAGAPPLRKRLPAVVH